MSDSHMKVSAGEKYERCVCCKEQLNILKTVSVDKREYYIGGCGQLCPSCHKKLTQPDKSCEEMTNEQMQYLIETVRRSCK